MDNLSIIIGLSVLAILFICIGHAYRQQIQMRLKQPLLRIPEAVLDWWSVSHFLLFAAFGYLEPGHHAKFFLLGLAFEVFEDMLSADETTQLVNCMDARTKRSGLGSLMCNGLQDDYWYAAWTDPFVNIAGYTLGSSFR